MSRRWGCRSAVVAVAVSVPLATAQVCPTGTTNGNQCPTDGSGNFHSWAGNYDANTGIFEGTMTTNLCSQNAYGVIARLGNAQAPGTHQANCMSMVFPASPAQRAAPLRGAVGLSVAGVNIYGPMEAGFGQNPQNQPCQNGQVGSCSPGLDVVTCEKTLEFSCGVANVKYDLLLDTCGGHAMPYHYHNDLACDYDHTLAGHSPLIGIALDGRGIYGLFESNPTLPNLDACNGHTGPTPSFTGTTGTTNPVTAAPSANVYHYHVTSTPPYTLGCFGPVSSVQQCEGFYADCNNVNGFETLFTAARPAGYCYDKDCPCYDSNGDNAVSADCNLPVPTVSPTRSPTRSPIFSNQVETPYFTCPLASCVNTATYANPVSVRIATTTPNSLIYYTVNGSNPTRASPRFDAQDIVINAPGQTIIRALAVSTGLADSLIAETEVNVQGITQQVQPVQFTCTSGGTVSACISGAQYQAPVSIGITTSTPASTIHYTIDGTAPTFASTQYILPIVRNVVGGLTVRAYARQVGMVDSPASSISINVVNNGISPITPITPVVPGTPPATNLNPTILTTSSVFNVPDFNPYVLSGAFTGITAPEAGQTVTVLCTPADSSLFATGPTVTVEGTQGRLNLQASRTGSTTCTCTARDNGTPTGSTSVTFTIVIGNGGGNIVPIPVPVPVPPGTPVGGTCNTGRVRRVQLALRILTSQFRTLEFGEAIARSTTQPLVRPYVCVYALCPAAACPNGNCPVTDQLRLLAGCLLPGQIPSREAEALQVQPTQSEVIFDFITPLSGTGGDAAQQAAYNDLTVDVNNCLIQGTCQMAAFVPNGSPRWVGVPQVAVTPAPDDDDSSSLSLMWLIIIIVLAVIALALIILLIWCCCCRSDDDDCCRGCCDDKNKRGVDQYGDEYPSQKGYQNGYQNGYPSVAQSQYPPPSAQAYPSQAYGQDQYNQTYDRQLPQDYEQAKSAGLQDLDGREMDGMQLREGQKVRALFIDGQVYDATIWEVCADGTYNVQWYDGTYSTDIPLDQITPID